MPKKIIYLYAEHLIVYIQGSLFSTRTVTSKNVFLSDISDIYINENRMLISSHRKKIFAVSKKIWCIAPGQSRVHE